MRYETNLRLLLGAALLLMVLSFCFPYCEVTLSGPGLPAGLHWTASVGHLEGSAVAAFPPAGRPPERQRIESSSRLAAGLGAALLALGLLVAGRPFAWMLRLPAVLLPAVVMADAAPWLEAEARGRERGLGSTAAVLAAHPGLGGLLAAAVALLLVASLFVPGSRRHAGAGGGLRSRLVAGRGRERSAARGFAGLLLRVAAG